MVHPARLLPSLALVLVCLGLALPVRAGDGTGPVVVELFTSQGCSTCPPADKMLHRLAERDDVIALALHVDYWDYIGWTDIFAQPQFTKRQKHYAHAAGSRVVYTPQMIIGGETHVIGNRPMEVMDAIGAHAARPYPVHLALRAEGGRLLVSAPVPETPLGEMVVQIVRYRPLETVEITRGENAGHTYDYANIVTALEVVGRWTGETPLALDLGRGADEPTVAIVQMAGFGPIVGAATLD